MKKFSYLMISILILVSISFFNFNRRIQIFANENDLKFDCISSYLCGINGEVLYSSKSDVKTQIASIVKLMTINLTFEEIEKGNLTYDTLLQVSEYASSMGGSQLFLDANTNHSLNDILKSVIVASANDSAVVLAETISGSEDEFVKVMNKRAKDWGMSNTLFTDCTGLSNDHYSTAYDVSIMASKVLLNPIYTKYSDIWLEEYTHPSGRKTQVANTNKLIRTQEGCVAGKTGTTDCAGYCLVNLTNKENMKLISVILGAKNSNDRFSFSKKLINYGYSNFKNMEILNIDIPALSMEMNNSKPTKFDIYYKDTCNKLVDKHEDCEFNIEHKLDEKIKLPLKIGDKVGVAVITDKNKNIISKIDLIIKQNVAKKNILDNIVDIFENW